MKFHKFICLMEMKMWIKRMEKGVVFVDKYQEVNKIVDEILKQIGEEIKNRSGV